MFDTFREPNFFTFKVIISQGASILTFSVDLCHVKLPFHIERHLHI